ncbi:MAG TPA: hypothetical protein VE955_07215 [Candidatus Dormibacteraeota bacterium]|jgi:hypothetical protein|nr:hypothetical protein [Candidatus Dormibacteraeota bacterium]
MKLQKQVALKKAGKTYYKWVIAIPGETVEKMGWKDGTELTTRTKNDELILRARQAT